MKNSSQIIAMLVGGLLLSGVTLYSGDIESQPPERYHLIVDHPLLKWNPVLWALWDVEDSGREAMGYADKRMTVRNYFWTPLLHPRRIWHVPVDLVLTSPKWATYWVYALGNGMTKQWEENVDHDNLYHGASVGLVGGTLKCAILGEIITEGVGIAVRDAARFVLLRPFIGNWYDERIDISPESIARSAPATTDSGENQAADSGLATPLSN